MPRIELNGEGEPVWLTPHLRDPQPEGERESTCMQHFDICNGLANARNNNIYVTMYLTLYIPWIF